MNFNAVIVRYGEISLKGKNRILFEKKLKSDIERFLESHPVGSSTVGLKRGRIYIRGIEEVPQLEKVLGIYSYSPALEIEKNMEALKASIHHFFPPLAKAKSFRVSCQRIDKKFEYVSMEVESILGEMVINETRTAVNLKNPDFNLQVEIGEEYIYLFSEKIRGFGGLPYGTAGKLVSLMSSGIDSPVATFLMMKRGVVPVLLHFKMTDEDFQKVRQLKEKLEEYTAGQKIELVTIPRDDIFKGRFSQLYRNQRYHSYICILCKYLMHRHAGEVARQHGALGLITGDNISQVASQTLKNLYAYRTVSGLPVYSPLIGFDKEETIRLARKIGTYDISVQRADACTPPKTPKTGVNPQAFQRVLQETGLDT
jgi:thiamine biosynthesis protein ThiI